MSGMAGTSNSGSATSAAMPTDAVTFDSVPIQQVDEWLTRLELHLTAGAISDAERIATLRAVLFNVRWDLGRVP